MRFTSLLKSIILENSRFEILRDALTKTTTDREGNRVKPKMTLQEFLQLVQADPTTRLNDVDPQTENSRDLEKIKAGKYVQWLIKNYLNPITERQPNDVGYDNEVKEYKRRFLEDLYKVTENLLKFERFKQRLDPEFRDINRLSVYALEDAVEKFDLEKKKGSKEEKKAAARSYQYPGSEVVYVSNDWTVVKIEGDGDLEKDAAQFFGGYDLKPAKGETSWCTSSPGGSMFNYYIKEGPLYIILPNNWSGEVGVKSGLPAERYQIHFPSGQFKDVRDREVDWIDMLNNKFVDLKQFFKPHFAKGVAVNGDKLVINDLRNGTIGKFISIYGLDDLFENLPLSLKQIQIQNRGRENIMINVPEFIGNFENLDMLMFDNCISKIPESVCNLKKLRFLALVNNTELKTIPGCLVNSPNLVFINLKGSPNVILPNEIEQVATDMGGGMLDLHDRKG